MLAGHCNMRDCRINKVENHYFRHWGWSEETGPWRVLLKNSKVISGPLPSLCFLTSVVNWTLLLSHALLLWWTETIDRENSSSFPSAKTLVFHGSDRKADLHEVLLGNTLQSTAVVKHLLISCKCSAFCVCQRLCWCRCLEEQWLWFAFFEVPVKCDCSIWLSVVVLGNFCRLLPPVLFREIKIYWRSIFSIFPLIALL